jgi:hypothetical protein
MMFYWWTFNPVPIPLVSCEGDILSGDYRKVFFFEKESYERRALWLFLDVFLWI